MNRGRELRGWLCAALIGSLLAGPGIAAGETLENLMGGGSLVSWDGSVVFDAFSYMPTSGAPGAGAINIFAHNAVSQGLMIQGSFQAMSGIDVDALLGFRAQVLAEEGTFLGARAALVVSDAVGYGSSVSMIERIPGATTVHLCLRGGKMNA